MVTVIFSKSIMPVQIDFPDGIQRSCKGAMHVRPGSAVKMTEQELDLLYSAHPDIMEKSYVRKPATKAKPIIPHTAAAKPAAKKDDKPKPKAKSEDFCKDEDKDDGK